MSSSVVGKVEAVSVKFRWEIEDYGLKGESKKCGEYFKSPKFPVGADGNVYWYFHLYPNGKDDKDHSSISVFANNAEIKAKATFKIFGNQNTVLDEQWIEEDIFGNKIGYGYIINTKTTKDMLKEDKLTVECELIYRSMLSEVKKQSANEKNHVEDNDGGKGTDDDAKGKRNAKEKDDDKQQDGAKGKCDAIDKNDDKRKNDARKKDDTKQRNNVKEKDDVLLRSETICIHEVLLILATLAISISVPYLLF